MLAEQAEYYPKLAAQTHIPLAAGERMFSTLRFLNVCWRQAVFRFCNRISPTQAVLPNATKLPEWQKPMT